MDSVRIFPNIKQKFVLVRARQAGEETILLWGNPNIEWHKDILEEMEKDGIEIIETFGGGWLFIDSESKKVHIWGKSDRLGLAPIELVQRLLGDDILKEEPK